MPSLQSLLQNNSRQFQQVYDLLYKELETSALSLTMPTQLDARFFKERLYRLMAEINFWRNC